MKQTLITFLLVVSQIVGAQSEFTEIEKTLQNYIEGSSYNKRNLIKSAFADNATLYLTTRDGFKRFTPTEYANFFKNAQEGQFNGRVGKILSLEIISDIAIAKVEIKIPKSKVIYIDLFLLKKS